jgi:SNF2 family DNA or RNA helicase
MAAGGLGIDLTAARRCVYYSLGFSLGDYEQSLARLHRPGQGHPVTYYHLVAEGTVDRRVYRALSKRRDVVESVLEELKR